MRNKLFQLMLFLLIIQLSVSGQEAIKPVIISGKIVAFSGKTPVKGANISFAKSNTSTVSRDEGIFSINLTEATDTLTVSYIGFKTKMLAVKHEQKQPLVVGLEEMSRELQDVEISTGYQRIPKERATGSFALVSNEVLNQQVGTNILKRLDGVSSGVIFLNKADGPTLAIRGLSTINGNKQPLIIVDNFPYEGDINNINPNEVAQVTILKDAAAASIWGARASNGVIVITTKKGRPGQPVKIALNTNVTRSAKPDLFYLPQLSSSDYIDLEQMLYGKGYYNSAITSSDHKPLSPVIELLAARDNGSITAAEAEAAIEKYRNHDVRNDYEKYMYQAALTQQYALNMSGGTGKMSYWLSGGYDGISGDLHQTNNRWNLRSNNQYQLTKNLQLEAGFTYTHTDSKTGRPGYNQVLVGGRHIPYLPFAGEGGKPLAVAKDYSAGYTDTAGGGLLYNWKYYPMEEYQHNNTKTASEHLLANLGLQWNIGAGLRADVKYQFEKQQTGSNNLQDAESYAARNMINRFSAIDYNSGLVNYGVPPGSILNTGNLKTLVNNLRGQLDYNKQFNRHALNAIAGAELRQISNRADYNTIYGYNEQLLLASNVDFINPKPVYTDGSYENIPNNQSFSEQLNRFVSWYGNVAYTYNNRYTISASGRKDASNVFGVKTNDKWNPLWSAGLAWNIAGEPFFKAVMIDQLKLRATYGYSGNLDINRAAVTTLIYAGPDIYTNFRYAQVDQFANPDLRWEKTATINLGVDFAAWRNRLAGSIEYFHKKSTDLFGPALVDYTSGINRDVIITNTASMKGYGFDIVVNGKIIQAKNAGWQTGILFSYNNSKTTAFYRSNNRSSLFVRDGNYITPIPGKPVYSIYSYAWGGLNATGDPQGFIDHTLSTDYNSILNSDKGVSSLVFAGSALPLYYGAWNNTAQYKGFSLAFNIGFKLGYYYRRESLNYQALITTGQGYSDYTKRWQAAGDELKTHVPALVYPLVNGRDEFYNNSEITVHRADNIRLQYVNIGYDFSPAQKNFQWQVYFNAANLGILWRADKGGPDPDYSSVLPPVKTFSVGIRASF